MIVDARNELIDPVEPEKIERASRDIAAFIREQIEAGASMGELQVIGYPRIPEEAAEDPGPTDHELAEAVKPTVAEPQPPKARLKGPPRARSSRDKAARDSRPDLKPFPYGTRQD